MPAVDTDATVAWATVVLVGVTAVYAMFTFGLLREARRDRRQRDFRELSEQARQVGGNIHWTGGDATRRTLTLELFNVSRLPVRRVLGTVFDAQTGERVGHFRHLSALVGEGRFREMKLPEAEFPDTRSLRLVLDFDDDNGTRWRKYESEGAPPRQLSPSEAEESRAIE